MKTGTDQLTIAQLALERIGYGSCGSVWANPGVERELSGVVLKRGDGLPDRSIANEHRVHQHIQSTIFRAHCPTSPFFRVDIPLNFTFLEPRSEDQWANILPRLPANSAPCQALVNERIMPLPRQIRRLLVEQFWNGVEDDSIVDDKRNEHCLIRPYLGRRRSGARRSMFKSISLRNYPLHMDQIEQLALPAEQYAFAMADTLAFLHWEARIDANDVEFVLAQPRVQHAATGTSPETTQPSIGTKEFTPGILGPHSMWLLDFDCCKELPMTEEGVHIAAERFWRNDPFFPNPDCKGCLEDERLWQVFRERYLDSSMAILREETEAVQRLPAMLVARIVETVGMYKRGVIH